MIKITVIFSTYNGAKTLRAFLDSLINQTLDKKYWKIVAVDNNSHDNTNDILQDYKNKLPLDILFEKKQGKSHAIDSAFKHIQGKLLVLTDDDVIAEPDWLEMFLKVSQEQKEYDIFSGLIVPNWEAPPPQWIEDWFHLGILYAINEEFEEGEIKPYHVSGPNSAFRDIRDKSGYIIDERLGPTSGKIFSMGEDALFAKSLSDKGAKTYHTRSAKVSHFISKNSLNENWILKEPKDMVEECLW